MIISTGSKPNPLDCVGSQWAWNSDDFFLQTTQPKRVAIIGGGYIAIELASILHYLGTQVIMLMRNSLLREFDADIVEECKQSLESAGVTIHQNCSIQAIQPETTDHHKHYTLLAHNPLNPNLSFANLDAVIVAIGRVPHLPESNIALTVDTHGGLKVNEHHQTNISSIYAIGDVIQRQNLTPVAIRAGRTVAEYLFNNNPTVMRYENIATAVFSLPPIACVGLSEQAAKQRYGQENILVYKNRYYPLKYANTPKLLSFSTCQKMIVERKSLKVLGLHMTGIDAPEIMQGFACCLQAGLTKPQLDATFPIHPTQAEEWVLMR
jgi:glutathione reductase (NADPH)